MALSAQPHNAQTQCSLLTLIQTSLVLTTNAPGASPMSDPIYLMN